MPIQNLPALPRVLKTNGLLGAARTLVAETLWAGTVPEVFLRSHDQGLPNWLPWLSSESSTPHCPATPICKSQHGTSSRPPHGCREWQLPCGSHLNVWVLGGPRLYLGGSLLHLLLTEYGIPGSLGAGLVQGNLMLIVQCSAQSQQGDSKGCSRAQNGPQKQGERSQG